MANKSFNDVQLFVTFTPEIDGAAKQAASVLYSNLDPTGATNMAIELAKIYTWTHDMLVFNPTATGTTPKVTIDPSVLPDIDTTYTFAEGTTDGAFTVTEEGSAAQTISVHNAATKASDGLVKEAQLPKYRVIKVDNAQVSGTSDRFKLQICRNWSAAAASQTWTDVSDINLGLFATSASGDDEIGKIKSALLPSYVDDIVEGYYYNSAWYSDSAHTTRIYGQSDKIYVDLATDKSYRCSPSGTPGQAGYTETWVDISNPLSAEEIYSLCGMPTGGNFSTTKHGLVPAASGSGDTNKFLKGDGTWATVPDSNTQYALSGAYGSSNTTWVSTLTSNDSTPVTSTSTVPSMIGADGTNAGKAGLVTKPAATDNTKFLRGDGTWATPSNTDTKVKVTLGTTTKAYLIGTSTTPNGTAVEGIGDTGVYLTTNAGELAATNFVGKVNNKTISGDVLKDVPADAVFTDTWTAMVGATSSAAGTAGYIGVAPPSSGYNTKYWRADGSWATPPNTTYTLQTTTYDSNNTKQIITLKPSSGSNTTADVNALVGANGSTAGKAGLAPKPAATDNVKYLRGDATWGSPVDDYSGTLILHCTNNSSIT